MMEVDDCDASDIMDVDLPNAGNDQSEFQKEVWQFRVFPYYEELKNDADNYFSHIKTGLAHSVLYRDARPGLIYWVYELERFIQLYSYRFTKVDHINMVKLLYNALTMTKLDFRVVKIVATTLTTLLSRRTLLKRADVQLDWRPLYDLYVEISYKNLEEDGVFLLPDNLKKTLCAVILECNNYFSDSATQEILGEARSFICPFDESTNRAFSIMRIFLPTALTPDEHDRFGAKLWFEEFWHWFNHQDNISAAVCDKILSLFGRLAKDCPFYIDWSDKFDVLFSHILCAFKLEVGTDRVRIESNTRIFACVTQLLAYLLGGEANGVQPHLNQLFSTVESYFYPSNCGGHTENLLTFMLKLSTNVMYRVSRERYRSDRYLMKIPKKYHLSDMQLDDFVKCLLPALKYGAFSKVRQELVPSIMRILAFLSPGIIIPAVLDLVYPALETITEPHRLVQSLHILACICVPLVRDDPTKASGMRLPVYSLDESAEDSHLKSYRRHALSILMNILPGIDVNDISKSILTFQIVGILLLLIPVVDCSEAILVCNDLTEEEKDLCSATACFDSFVDQLLNRIFAMIEMVGNSASLVSGERQTLTKAKAKSMEEMVIEKGVLTVVKALVRNCSTSMYKSILNKFYTFFKESMFDSKPAMDTMTRITSIFIGNNPSYAFPIFFNFASEKLHKILTDEMCADDEVDAHAIWYLTLASEVLRGTPGTVIFENRKSIDQLLALILRCKCKDAFHLVACFAQNVLYSLCSIYPILRNYFEDLDQPFDKYLPIRHWARTIEKNNWTIKWHVPSDEEVSYATELLEILVFDNLKLLSNPESMKDLEILKCLTIIHYAVEGCSNLCPFFDGEYVAVMPTVTPNVHFSTTVLPRNVKTLTARDVGNFRRAIYVEIKKLADYLLTKRENDTKSMLELINVIKILLHVRGVDSVSYQMQYSTFQLTKRILSDPVKGNAAIIETIMEGIVAFMHARRQLSKPLIGFTITHLDVLKLLVRLGTSSYSGVRIEAQKALDTSFTWWSYSYKLVLDDILKILSNPQDYSHKTFKGALYMLLNGKDLSICVRQDWETLNKVWPTMVRAHHSEKPSIISLFETAQDIIVGNFSSFQICFSFPDSIMRYAKALLALYDGCVHKPVWPDLSDEQLAQSRRLEDERNERNTNLYYKLSSELLKLSTDNTLHWRHVNMAQSFLSLMLRRDMVFPDEVVLLFFRLLVSDTIKTRGMAIALVGSWLKIYKPKSAKTVYSFPEALPENCGPNAKWPIKYGFRKDNQVVVYDPEKQPTSAEAWNSTRFLFKIHWGFYTWPSEFRVYAPPNEQLDANRSDFSRLERSIINIFADDAFLDKMLQFLSLEEKKGHDQFNGIYYSLFYRLFRNFNIQLFEPITQHLDRLLTNREEGPQRLAAEIVAGMVNGSKLWTYDKLELMWRWLTPRLITTLEGINTESERNWGTCMATMYGVCEPRQLHWLTELLFALVRKPCDNSYHITARLYLLHCALNQFKWRIPTLWRELYDRCLPLVGHSYQSIRYRVGSCISTAIVVHHRDFYVDPTVRLSFRLVDMDEAMNTMNVELNNLWKTALKDDDDSATTSSVTISGGGNGSSDEESKKIVAVAEGAPNGGNGDTTLKKEKLILLTLVNTLYSMTAQPMFSLGTESIYRLIPLLAHYSYEKIDEELKNSCQLLLIRCLGTAPVVDPDKDIPTLLEICSTVAKRSVWWKSKMGLLRFLQIFVFANLYILKHRYASAIQELLLDMINDPQLEVRCSAADTLSGLIHCSFLNVDKSLLDHVEKELSTRDQPLKLHSGILTLSAVIQAFPYTVPSFLPDALMMLCKHAHDPQPIYGTVKKTLSEFKRTHQDCWHEHKREFTEEQLTVLTDLLVSPNYYV